MLQKIVKWTLMFGVALIMIPLFFGPWFESSIPWFICIIINGLAFVLTGLLITAVKDLDI